MGKVAPREKVTVDALLGGVMESVRTTTVCESVYVRTQVSGLGPYCLYDVI